jgi:hypothetical protein
MPTRRRNKISRRNKKNKISKKTNQTKRQRGGDKYRNKNVPMHPDPPSAEDLYKQHIKRIANTIINDRIDADNIYAVWQNEGMRDEEANPMALDVSIVVPANARGLTAPYSPSVFWGKLFSLEEIKNIIIMLKSPLICNEVMGLLPAFENKPLVLIESEAGVMRDGMMVYSDDKQKQTDNWTERCNAICRTLIILGIISSKMQTTKQDYMIISKGGLSVSLMLSRLTREQIKVPINDLDFKIIPTTNIPYVPGHANNLAMHICAFVQHILSQVISRDKGYEMKLLPPMTTGRAVGYKDLVKLSLKPHDSGYIPILDMDFGDYTKDSKYFDDVLRIDGEMPAATHLPFPVRFIYQSTRLMLAEKLYYYAQYFFIKEDLQNKQHGRLRASPFGDMQYDPLSGTIMHDGNQVTAERCGEFLIKFKKSILLLTAAMIESSQLDSMQEFKDLEENAAFKDILDEDPEYETFRRMLQRMLIDDLLERFSREGLFPTIAICKPKNKSTLDYLGKGVHHIVGKSTIDKMTLTTDIMCDQILEFRIASKMLDSLYPRVVLPKSSNLSLDDL